jgi:hypothetical protein
MVAVGPPACGSAKYKASAMRAHLTNAQMPVLPQVQRFLKQLSSRHVSSPSRRRLAQPFTNGIQER